jgi:predicted NACHT family NTPase
MMNQRLRDISQTEAVNTISVFLNRVDPKARADEFLNDILMSSGLLLEREAGYWSFASLGFQEYLTAAHWLEERVIRRDWSGMINDSWWHETLLLYSA